MVRTRVNDSHSISESLRRDEVTFRFCYLLVIKSQASHSTFVSFIFLTCEIDLINSNLKMFSSILLIIYMTYTYRMVSMYQASKIHYLVPFSKQFFGYGVSLPLFSDVKTEALR